MGGVVGAICGSNKVSSDDGPADDVPVDQPNQQGNAPGPAPAPVEEEAQEPVAPAVEPVEEEAQEPEPVEEVAAPVEEVPAPAVEEHVPEDPVPRQRVARAPREPRFVHAIFPVGHPPYVVDYFPAVYERIHPQGNPEWVGRFRMAVYDSSSDDDEDAEGDHH